MKSDFSLLKELCEVRATSGDEAPMKEFLLNYIEKESSNWKVKPEILASDELQDSLILVFGKPRVAIFAHIDSIGYAAAYDDNLVKIGGPKAEDGTKLVGADSQGEIECELSIKKKKKKSKPDKLRYKFEREIERGTPLTYKPNWRETKKYVNCCYLDNRLGVWNALHLCKDMEHGAIVFSTYEEHGGGSAQAAGGLLQSKYGVRQALICDVSLISKGIKHGKGPVVSMRDRGVPRQSYVRQIMSIAHSQGIPFQAEVESAGGSDGNSLQDSEWFWDWCFIGPAEANYHTPKEKVHKQDIAHTLELYRALLKNL